MEEPGEGEEVDEEIGEEEEDEWWKRRLQFRLHGRAIKIGGL